MNKCAVLLVRNKDLISESIQGKTLFEYTMDTLKTASIETVYYCGNDREDDRLTVSSSYKELFNELSDEEGRILLVDIDYPFLCPETLTGMLESEGNLVLADYVNITDVFALEKKDLNHLDELFFDQMPFSDDAEKIHITDAASLAEAAEFERKRISRSWLEKGVRFEDPERVYIGHDAEFGSGVKVGLDVSVTGKSVIGENAEIASFSRIENSTVGSHCLLGQTIMKDSSLGDRVRIGSYTEITAGCEIAEDVAIGGFTSLRRVSVGKNSAIGTHCSLSFTRIGESVRIGSGVSAIDPDGGDDDLVEIKDYAYIGNNVILVAPVTVGEIAAVAAGTTLTEDVDDGDSVIGRTRQMTRKGMGLEYIAKESKR
ncbi:MAG: hypothetical protein IKF46_06305 [Erysipelotrichaceae bacterium]|nr:hypothetical protein [Erysipelotrichaceae bacterium]